VAVVPTTTQPQGVAALLAWRPEAGLDENAEAMAAAAAPVRTGAVVSDGSAVQGPIDSDPVLVAASLAEAVRALVGRLADQGRDVITLYAGSGVALADVQAIADELGKTTDATVEAAHGGQRDSLVVVSAE
jgi:dihydroxyacetone kinase-like predicted kinase